MSHLMYACIMQILLSLTELKQVLPNLNFFVHVSEEF